MIAGETIKASVHQLEWNWIVGAWIQIVMNLNLANVFEYNQVGKVEGMGAGNCSKCDLA